MRYLYSSSRINKTNSLIKIKYLYRINEVIKVYYIYMLI